MPTPAKQDNGRPREVQGIAVKVFPVESESTPGKHWEVTLWMEGWRGFTTGLLTCNCPAWLYQAKPLNHRSCKHTQAIGHNLATHKDLVERVDKSEIFIKSDLPTNGRLAALLKSVLSE